MNDTEEIMFSKIIEIDRKSDLYNTQSLGWHWFKIILIVFTILIILVLLGI